MSRLSRRADAVPGVPNLLSLRNAAYIATLVVTEDSLTRSRAIFAERVSLFQELLTERCHNEQNKQNQRSKPPIPRDIDSPMPFAAKFSSHIILIIEILFR